MSCVCVFKAPGLCIDTLSSMKYAWVIYEAFSRLVFGTTSTTRTTGTPSATSTSMSTTGSTISTTITTSTTTTTITTTMSTTISTTSTTSATGTLACWASVSGGRLPQPVVAPKLFVNQAAALMRTGTVALVWLRSASLIQVFSRHRCS